MLSTTVWKEQWKVRFLERRARKNNGRHGSWKEGQERIVEGMVHGKRGRKEQWKAWFLEGARTNQGVHRTLMTPWAWGYMGQGKWQPIKSLLGRVWWQWCFRRDLLYDEVSLHSQSTSSQILFIFQHALSMSVIPFNNVWVLSSSTMMLHSWSLYPAHFTGLLQPEVKGYAVASERP